MAHNKRFGGHSSVCLVIVFGPRKQEMGSPCHYAIFRTKMTQFKWKHYPSSEAKGRSASKSLHVNDDDKCIPKRKMQIAYVLHE